MSRLKKINKNQRLVYERTKQEEEPRRSSGLWYLLVFIILVGLGYIVFFSGLLDISRTEIDGYSNPEIVEEIIESYQGSSFLNNNIIFFDETGMVEAIKGDSGVREVNVKRILPNTLRVEIVESVGVISWNTAGESFVVDERGYVIEKNNSETLPIVFDNVNIATGLGERVASPTLIKYIIEMWGNFQAVTGHEVEKIIILDILSDIHVESKSGWTVYFDSNKDPLAQLDNLSKILRTIEESGRKDIKYIDMRLDNRVYYK